MALTEAAKRKKGVGRKFHFGPELLYDGRQSINIHPIDWSGLWEVAMFGFHFAMRIGDIGSIEDRDIPVVAIEDQPCATVHIRSSETDQCKLGARRALALTGRAPCAWNFAIVGQKVTAPQIAESNIRPLYRSEGE